MPPQSRRGLTAGGTAPPPVSCEQKDEAQDAPAVPGLKGIRCSSTGTLVRREVVDFAKVANHGVKEARRLVDVRLDGGINVFGTANTGPLGRSEEIVGEVLEGRRDRVLIWSKACMPLGDGLNDEGASRYHLVRECERSLKRLRTDHVDIHSIYDGTAPPPVEEMLGALDTLVPQGKIRYIGCSNFFRLAPDEGARRRRETKIRPCFVACRKRSTARSKLCRGQESEPACPSPSIRASARRWCRGPLAAGPALWRIWAVTGRWPIPPDRRLD